MYIMANDITISPESTLKIKGDTLRKRKILVVLLVILILGILVVFAIIGIIKTPKNRKDEYKKRCDQINDVIKQLGVDDYDHCEFQSCEGNSTYTAKGLDTTKPNEPGCPPNRVINNIGCCELKTDGSDASFKTKMDNFVHNNPVMSVLLGGVILQKIAKLGTAAAKRFTTALTTVARTAAPEATRAAAAAAGRVSGAAASAAERQLSKSGPKAVKKAIGDMSVKFTEKIGAKVGAKITEMQAGLTVPGPGWLWSAINAGLLVLDIADPRNYGQYMDNVETIMNTRDQVEGSYIMGKRQSDSGKIRNGFPPYLFTIDTMFLYLPDKPKESDTEKLNDWADLAILTMAWKQAHDDYINKCLEKACGELSDDDLDNICHFFSEVIEGSADADNDLSDVHLPEDVSEKITKYVNLDIKERDSSIYKYLKLTYIEVTNPVTSETVIFDWNKYGKYILYDDTGAMSAYGSTITISELSKQKWESIANLNTNYIMPVYTKYYRNVKSSREGTTTDRWPSQDLPGKSYTRNHHEVSDLSGQTLYELETKELPRKWMLISPLPSVKQMCKTGVHIPSIASLLLTLADQKLCEASNRKYIPGNCTNSRYSDQPSCITKEDPELNDKDDPRIKRLTKDGRTFATGFYTKSQCCVPDSYEPGRCTKNGNEISAKNVVDCEVKLEGEWTEPTCDRGLEHSTPNDLDDVTRKIINMAKEASPDSTGKNPFLNVTDISPSDYQVIFDEDTGICKYTEQYCGRFGRNFESVPHHSLSKDQRLTRCYDTANTEFISLVLSDTMIREINEATTQARMFQTRIETDVGNFLETIGIRGAGGTGTGSFSYAMDHPGERIGHWFGDGAEDVGKDLDKVVYDSGGLTTWGGSPAISIPTFPIRLAGTLIGRGYDAIFD